MGADVALAPTEIGVDAPLPMDNGKLHTSTVHGAAGRDRATSSRTWCFRSFTAATAKNGTLQALLDWVGIPYTGSGMLASAMAMNKEVTCARHARGGRAGAAGICRSGARELGRWPKSRGEGLQQDRVIRWWSSR